MSFVEDTARALRLTDQSAPATEGTPVLLDYQPSSFSDSDRNIFDTLVRRDHYLRRAETHIDFLDLRRSIEVLYKAGGRPAEEPVLMLKLEFLQYHDNLSDRQVFKRAETDVAYRWFLGLGRDDYLPDWSTLGRFRARLGAEGHKRVFHALLAQGRQHGLLKDRLRIKDATHVIANIAVPATLRLAAQARNRLLCAAEPFDPQRVAGERVRIAVIRETTDRGAADVRLLARVTHLCDIVAWVDELEVPSDADENFTWHTLQEARRVACKLLADQDGSTTGDRLLSTSDPDARRGRHGEFFDGYLVDVMMDADSELFTAINVLPANGAEGADAVELVAQEQEAHGNRIEQLSIDGAGYDGSMLRELEDPEGPGIDVYVPPRAESNGGRFTPEDFVENSDGSRVTCPAGQESRYRQRDTGRHATIHRFDSATCQACPSRGQCMKKAPGTFGRTVRKNDYEPEYARVREKSQTEAYADVKQEHPKVERKLGELTGRHGGRRARYRGRLRVLAQEFVAATVTNMKRMVQLLDAENPLTAPC